MDAQLATSSQEFPAQRVLSARLSMAFRVALYLAGKLPNTRANLELWISHPQQYDPGTAMPEMGVTADDARQIAAYLNTAH